MQKLKITKKSSNKIFIISRKQIITSKLINKLGNLATNVGKGLSFLDINSNIC